MTLQHDESRMRHMLQHAQEAVEFAAGRLRSDLDTDRQFNLALVRLLEIVGEAGARVSHSTQQRYSTIPWSQIVGLRNRLIHGYDAVDFDILWDIIRIDLPPLIAQLSCIVGDRLAEGITESLIRQHPHPSDPACVYSWEWFLENGDGGVADLPIGLQRLVAVQRVDGHIANGGFWALLGDRTGRSTDTLDDSLHADLRAFGDLELTDSLDIAKTAIEEWLVRLPGWRAAVERGERADVQGFASFADPLNRRRYEQQSAMYAQIDDYIKSHPDEFIHP